MNTRSIVLITGIVMVALFFVVGRTARGITILRGSGTILSEDRAVSDFQAIDFSGTGKLTIVQGEREALTIEADDNLLPYITSKVSNGTLKIEVKEGAWRPIPHPTQPVHYTVYVNKLARLEMAGAGEVYMAALHADDLELSSSGVDTISINDLTATDLAVQMSGAGSVKLAGRVTTQNVQIGGLGNYDAADLESQDAHVTLSGAGSATVWAQTELDADLSGAGIVSYYGEPHVSSSATGLVNVHSLGMK
jgi:hypothetical protein